MYIPRANLSLLLTSWVEIPLSEDRMVSLPCGLSHCLVHYLGETALTTKTNRM